MRWQSRVSLDKLSRVKVRKEAARGSRSSARCKTSVPSPDTTLLKKINRSHFFHITQSPDRPPSRSQRAHDRHECSAQVWRQSTCESVVSASCRGTRPGACPPPEWFRCSPAWHQVHFTQARNPNSEAMALRRIQKVRSPQVLADAWQPARHKIALQVSHRVCRRASLVRPSTPGIEWLAWTTHAASSPSIGIGLASAQRGVRVRAHLQAKTCL